MRACVISREGRPEKPEAGHRSRRANRGGVSRHGGPGPRCGTDERRLRATRPRPSGSSVTEATDFIHQFRIERPEARPAPIITRARRRLPGETGRRASSAASSSRPPPPRRRSDFRFCVMTCQGYPDRDHPDGHPIYPSMLALAPKFVTMTGDLVYYDSNEPRAVTPALARLHWERMFSLPRLVAMMRNASSYWLKDDHDTLSRRFVAGHEGGRTDVGRRSGDLPAAGADRRTELSHVPLGTRSPDLVHRRPRLPLAEQDARRPGEDDLGGRAEGVVQAHGAESDATWKVLVSPTPLVGPDRPHQERQPLQRRLRSRRERNPRVAQGARARTTSSSSAATGTGSITRCIRRRACRSSASARRAIRTPAARPARTRDYHRFHRVKGGFLCVELRPEGRESVIDFQLRDVDGAVVYEARFRRSVLRKAPVPGDPASVLPVGDLVAGCTPRWDGRGAARTPIGRRGAPMR